MSRFSDVAAPPARKPKRPLPVINWKAVGRQRPKVVSTRSPGPKAPLPNADVVVITWTTAEWSALDHVFVSSDVERFPSSFEFQEHWCAYTKSAPRVPPAGKYKPPPLWGSYRMVKIDDATGKAQRVLLFKANAHLAYPLWIKVLEQMVARIIDEAEPDRIYSIGTAGGSSVSENLGDAAITNSAHLELQNPHNTWVGYNNQTFTSPWYPSTKLIPRVQKKLLVALDTIVDSAELEFLLQQLYQKNPAAKAFGRADLVNAPMRPRNLGSPRALERRDVPLLTTDFYFIADDKNSRQYCALEMDDAVIAKVAADKGVKYCFVRNISDPIVPSLTTKKRPIPDDVRSDWSGLIYNSFGLYTSFNGALLTWATIAGHHPATAG